MLSIEAAPLVLESCRQSNLIVAHIKVDVCAGRVPGAYVVPLVHMMVGILRNRFSVLWDPAMECLAALIDTVGVTAWDVLTDYLQHFQKDFLSQPVFESRKREDVREGCVCLPHGITKLPFCLDSFTYLCDLRYFISCCYTSI